jgi:mRNA-degrading endonuclease RelE of RelBE toxin-antitoxin system
MRTSVVYTRTAKKDLHALGTKEAVKVASKIDFYSKQENPLKYSRKLRPPFDNLYRFRIGEYRAVFELGKNGQITLLIILRIKNRKDIYE